MCSQTQSNFPWGYLPESAAAEAIVQLRPRIVSIWAVDRPQKVMDPAGSGFILRSGFNSKHQLNAIVVTSEYVLRVALASLESRGAVPKVSKTGLVERFSPILAARTLLLKVHEDAGPLFLPVRRLSFNPRCGLAILVGISDRTEGLFPHLAIDSDPLEPGTTILSVGYRYSFAEQSSSTTDERSITRQGAEHFELRVGQITGIQDTEVLTYQTTLPLYPGMLGGPVFTFKPNATGGMTSHFAVVGIASVDDTPREQIDDVQKRGSAQVVAAQELCAVAEPVAPNIASWQNRKPHQYVRAPFGAGLQDQGTLRSQLVVRIDALSTHPRIERIDPNAARDHQQHAITQNVWVPLPQDNPKGGFVRQCWAASIGGCNDISREHMLSATVCEALGRSHVSARLGNTGKRIPSNAVQLRILCQHHNQELSPFDKEAGLFVAKVAEYHRGPKERLLVSRGAPSVEQIAVSGWKLERWFLKTFLNHAIWQGAIDISSAIWHAKGANLVEYLYKAAALPEAWGLYGLPLRQNHPFAPKMPFHRHFACDIMSARNARIFRQRTRTWSDGFSVPVWYYLTLFGFELAFVANISPFGDPDYLALLSGLHDDPRRFSLRQPQGFHYQRQPPADSPGDTMTRLDVILDWKE